MEINLHIAPMQGYTQAPWRHFRREVYGGVWPEYTPFIRVERGAVRSRDLRDYTTPFNEGAHVAPQVIFRDVEELKELIDLIMDNGAQRIDLNCGCPYPPQVKHGRGTAVVSNPKLMKEVSEFIKGLPEIAFSMKMRLGVEQPDEWEGVIDIINDMPLEHVTVHPRVARQQYKGEPDMEQFARLLGNCEHPVVFNGDVRTPSDAEVITKRFPTLAGIMIGRGVCARPSLLTEVAQGREWSERERLEKLLEFHGRLLEYYEEHLCGETQVLQHIKRFWDYSEDFINRKALKKIGKASNLSNYHAALAAIRHAPEA